MFLLIDLFLLYNSLLFIVIEIVDDNKNNEKLLSLFSDENNIIHQYFCLYKRTMLLLCEMSKYIKVLINSIENNSTNTLILQILFKIYKEIVLNTLIK